MAIAEVRRLLLPPYDNNCYLLVCPETQESLVIDAPSEPERILELAQGTRIRQIVITHNHRDHWGALAELKQRAGAQVAAHPEDAAALPVPLDLSLQDGDLLRIGTITVQVIHTPGHTPGSLCLLTGRHLFTGDTLFPGGPGHTRTPQDLLQTIQSITTRLFPLSDDVQIYPGHGAGTELGTAKQEYAVFAAKAHDPSLCGDVTWLES
ncbi:MAG: MBL fold metallo-hydrolase [Chloroflexi bacterium]|nr:MBL fold metallo-hydrolase [Chloroflexota bacterium]